VILYCIVEKELIDDGNKPESYVQFCFMKLPEAQRVSEMIASRVDFSPIGIEINLNKNEYSGILPRCVCQDDVLVAFRIPFKGISMPTFYGEMCKCINLAVVERTRVEENMPLVTKIKKVLFS
jgi:hypothetical protein